LADTPWKGIFSNIYTYTLEHYRGGKEEVFLFLLSGTSIGIKIFLSEILFATSIHRVYGISGMLSV
jgi:hypothetical protein